MWFQSRDVRALERNPAGERANQARYAIDQRALATVIRPEQAEYFALVDVQRNAGESRRTIIGSGEALNAQHRWPRRNRHRAPPDPGRSPAASLRQPCGRN